MTKGPDVRVLDGHEDGAPVRMQRVAADVAGVEMREGLHGGPKPRRPLPGHTESWIN